MKTFGDCKIGDILYTNDSRLPKLKIIAIIEYKFINKICFFFEGIQLTFNWMDSYYIINNHIICTNPILSNALDEL